jgi:hypothetical protein
MKIFIGANNNSGSNLFLSSFINNAKDCEFKTASFYRNSFLLKNIDWILDVVYDVNKHSNNYLETLGCANPPKVSPIYAEMILNHLADWKPDLVISECEPFSAHIAKLFEVPLWYCSSFLQIPSLNINGFFPVKNSLKKLPKGDRYFVYSFIGNIEKQPSINEGYEWVSPYPESIGDRFLSFEEDSVLSTLSKKIYVTTGETGFVSYLLENDIEFVVSPSIDNYEQTLNAVVLEQYGLANNIGKPKSISFGLEKVSVSTKKVSYNKKWPLLHERINNEFCSV